MTNYRKILRLSSLGFNKTQIAQGVGCSRTTVIQVLNVADEKGVSYPLPEDSSPNWPRATTSRNDTMCFCSVRRIAEKRMSPVRWGWLRQENF